MERAKEERRRARALFTRCGNKLEDALSSEDPSAIGAAYSNLEGKWEKLQEIDNRIFSLWFDEQDKNEQEYERDVDTTEEYTEKWYELKQKYKEATEENTTVRKCKTSNSSSCASTATRLNSLLKLPKLELPKFDGDVRKWIHFWGIFEKVHDDPNMSDDIKFQYLVQCMEPGSAAEKITDSYPPTAANYTKAIEQLKDRFGREELLIEIYVRELLTLVLEQKSNDSSTPIATLYDKLKTQLNALESLGVTSDRYAAMLRPLVESALPVDLLRVWERKSKDRRDQSSLLANLLDFIKLEVESDERIMISRNVNVPNNPSASCFTTGVKEAPTKATASRSSTADKRNCLFCDKSTQHVSSECSKAMKMTLQERKDFVKSKRACYICLTPGHMASRCRCPVKCMICKKRHVTLMCGNATEPNLSTTNNVSHDAIDQTPQTLMNHSSSPITVLLPTLILKVAHKNQSITVRALLDSGAQKSFIKTSVAKALNLKPCGETQISHNLFGGVVTKKEVHKSYIVSLQSIEIKYEAKIQVLEQFMICQDLPRADKGIIESLKERGVQLSDASADVGEISLLIGADFLGSLMTGRMITLSNNLIAIETHFGWSVQGPSTGIDSSSSHVNCATFDVEDLWRLETVGIKDDAQTHKVTESETTIFFERTIRFNEEGRYEVKFSDRLSYFSKHTKTTRTVAWCIRFYRNCSHKIKKNPIVRGDISAAEYETAGKTLFGIIQRDEFTDIESLRKSLNMDVYEGEDKLLRVKTRLTVESDEEDFIAPIILPSSNSLVQNLVRYNHVNHCHAGVLTLLNKLREHVWIIGIRLLAKKVVRECAICRRYSTKKLSTPPAPLPADRTRCGAAFEVTGIDYAGPLHLRNREKCWIALFTCATYRAVHLELCRSLTTEEFMLALRRFIARRGRPKTIYSDNGTNFRGAERLLRNIDWQKIEADTSVEKITWRFSPPSAPWWGGFWERMVKSVKEMLRRMLGKASLDAVSLQTTLCEIESVLNSRPLTYTDTNELVAITPAHFLQSATSFGTPDLNQIDLNSRLRYLQKIRDDFRTRFRNEYLSLLMQQSGKRVRTVQPGDVVLVECDNAKRLDWPLALVLEVYKGPDGHSRVALIKTAKGELVRPVRRLFPLEASESQ